MTCSLCEGKCCLCGNQIEDKYGHNAEPLKSGRCCADCNQTKVIPARMKISARMKNG